MLISVEINTGMTITFKWAIKLFLLNLCWSLVIAVQQLDSVTRHRQSKQMLVVLPTPLDEKENNQQRPHFYPNFPLHDGIQDVNQHNSVKDGMHDQNNQDGIQGKTLSSSQGETQNSFQKEVRERIKQVMKEKLKGVIEENIHDWIKTLVSGGIQGSIPDSLQSGNKSKSLNEHYEGKQDNKIKKTEDLFSGSEDRQRSSVSHEYEEQKGNHDKERCQNLNQSSLEVISTCGTGLHTVVSSKSRGIISYYVHEQTTVRPTWRKDGREGTRTVSDRHVETNLHYKYPTSMNPEVNCTYAIQADHPHARLRLKCLNFSPHIKMTLTNPTTSRTLFPNIEYSTTSKYVILNADQSNGLGFFPYPQSPNSAPKGGFTCIWSSVSA